jgi:hypothetical protein
MQSEELVDDCNTDDNCVGGGFLHRLVVMRGMVWWRFYLAGWLHNQESHQNLTRPLDREISLLDCQLAMRLHSWRIHHIIHNLLCTLLA